MLKWPTHDIISYVVFNYDDETMNWGDTHYLGYPIKHDSGPTRWVRYITQDDLGIRCPSHIPPVMKLEDLGL
jgi:hypothetical protein